MDYKEYKVKVFKTTGTICWYNYSHGYLHYLHREDGPAKILSNGDKEWWIDGKRHRENGPAIEYKSYKAWYINDLRHREDGPAIEHTSGEKEYWIYGVKLTEAEFNARKSSCDGKVVEIDGRKYKLIGVAT